MPSLFSSIFGRREEKQKPQSSRPKIIPFTPRSFWRQMEPAEFSSYEQLKTYTSWVYRCVKTRADILANISLRLYSKKNEEEITEITKHDVLDLLDKVNNGMTRYDLFEHWGILMGLNGECFWWKMKGDNGKVVAIYPFFIPAYMQIVPGENEFVKGYVYRLPGGATEIPFNADEIVHFKEFNPLNPYRGMSPVKAAELSIATDIEAKKWNWRFFRNSAKPYGILKVPGTLDQGQYDRIRNQWESEYGSASGQEHKMAILEEGMDYAPGNFTQKDMEFIEQRRMDREEIFSIFGIPKGIFEGEVNRTTAEAHRANFIENTITPLARKLIYTLNEFLLPDFGDDNLFFNFDSLSPRDTENDLRYYESGLKNGWLTLNEVRRDEEYPEFEGGNQILVPFNMQPIGEVEKGIKKIKLDIRKVRRSFDEKAKDAANAALKEKGILKTLIKNGKSKKKFQKKRSSFSEEIKEQFWRMKIALTNRQEIPFKLLLQKQFRRQKKNVLNSVKEKEYKSIKFAFDVDEEEGIFVRIFKPIVADLIKRHGENIFQILGMSPDEFADTSQNIREFLSKEGLKFAQEVNETTKEKIKEAIQAGIDEGEGFDKIRSRIEDFFEASEKNRAISITRTEVAKSSNFGTLEGFEQSGVVEGKEWFTAEDERVCEICEPLHGEIVEIDGNFRGDDLFGRVEAPPAHVSCRCVLLPVIKK